jgi:hypothetical protein
MRLSRLILNNFSNRSCGGPPPIICNDAVHLAESKFTKRTCARPSLCFATNNLIGQFGEHTPKTNASLFLNEQTLVQPWPSSTFALFQRSPLLWYWPTCATCLLCECIPRIQQISFARAAFASASSLLFHQIRMNMVLYIRVPHGEWWVSQAGREAEEAYLLILLALCPADKRFL